MLFLTKVITVLLWLSAKMQHVIVLYQSTYIVNFRFSYYSVSSLKIWKYDNLLVFVTLYHTYHNLSFDIQFHSTHEHHSDHHLCLLHHKCISHMSSINMRVETPELMIWKRRNEFSTPNCNTRSEYSIKLEQWMQEMWYFIMQPENIIKIKGWLNM